MRKTNWDLYNLSEEDQIKICEQYIKLSNYDDYTYWNYDCIILLKSFIYDKNTILDKDGPDYKWYIKKGPSYRSINLNLEEVYNLLKPLLRKEKLNKILNNLK